MERVLALADQQGTVVAGELAGRTRAVEGDAADAADFVVREGVRPGPGGDEGGGGDGDFHCFGSRSE